MPPGSFISAGFSFEAGLFVRLLTISCPVLLRFKFVDLSSSFFPISFFFFLVLGLIERQSRAINPSN